MFGWPSWLVNAIGAALIAAVVAGVGAHLASIWYAPQIAGYKAQARAQKTESKAVEAADRVLSKIDSMAETKAQATIKEQTRVIIQKVPVYVSAAPVGCVTVGMLRLHDAAVLGIEPADLHPPAGQSDDACSGVSSRDFMAAVASNYGAARQNAEQMNALEVDITARIAALVPGDK